MQHKHKNVMYVQLTQNEFKGREDNDKKLLPSTVTTWLAYLEVVFITDGPPMTSRKLRQQKEEFGNIPERHETY